MKALQFRRSVPRFAAARIAGELAAGAGAKVGPLKLVDIDEPSLPGPGWQRVRPRLSGICGSDLSTIDGRASRYFEPIVSFPFVPGHEVVGELDDGRRVVVEPVLSCATRGIDPPCSFCAAGETGRCQNLAHGHVGAGLQTGYCEDTGGGWSTSMVAHESQLHAVDDALDDESAVLIEPTACAVHAVLRAHVPAGGIVAVIGAGTLGLTVVAALTRFAEPGQVIVAAKHPEQRDAARRLGAHDVVAPSELARAVRRADRCQVLGDRLSGGAHVVLDCVGGDATIDQSLTVARPGGRVVLVGMPGHVGVDLAPLWQREVELVGAYAYGTEHLNGREAHTFDLAAELVANAGLGRLVSASYPLEQYREGIDHAANAGRRGATKIVFDLRHERERRL